MDQPGAVSPGVPRRHPVRPLVEGASDSAAALGSADPPRRSPVLMKRQSWLLLIVVLALVGGGAGFLNHQRTSQKLGTPGVKVVPVPTYDTTGKLVASNSVFLPEQVLNYTSEVRPVTEDTLSWLAQDT